ncbi:MAG TPA: CPBP family intramembrane glutamic endopeptidase, partial [Caulobacteraceae bacterium]|nr:CPBP family intramembrane glutamic endopeptidase [Caulobacteraceae bacterium]
WPRSTSERRRELLRWNPIPLRTFGLAVVAGVLALGAFGGLWIAVSDLAHIPPGVQPKAPPGTPVVTLIALLLMSSIAAPLTEEAAFRGYATGILKRAWGSRSAAVLGATALFAAGHFLQGLDPLKLSLYFAAGLIFALVAEVTNSLYAAMVVHGLGDILGFTVLWPHDQQAHAMGFADPLFAPALVALVIFTPAAVFAFRRLARPPAPGGGGRHDTFAGSTALGR